MEPYLKVTKTTVMGVTKTEPVIEKAVDPTPSIPKFYRAGGADEPKEATCVQWRPTSVSRWGVFASIGCFSEALDSFSKGERATRIWRKLP